MGFDLQGIKNLSFWLVSLFFSSLAFCGTDSKSSEATYVSLKNVRPEGNIILDDSSLVASLDMGSGFYLAPELLNLITQEVEGYYSSNGFHRVRAYITQPKSIKGMLDLIIDEQLEIKSGKSDNLRAKIAIDRLIARHGLKPGDKTKKNAVATLVEGYRMKRAANIEAESLRIQTEQAQAKMQRENLMDIFNNQQQFLVEQEKAQTEILKQMRHRIQTIIDTRFNGSAKIQDEQTVDSTP